MTKTQTITVIGSVLVLLLVAIYSAGFLGAIKANPALGSVTQGEDYNRINYAASNAYGATTTAALIIRGGPGALGSVVITGAAAGVLNFYDATTSDVTKRTGNAATSTILLASIPASLTAGTYVFDVAFGRGLLVDLTGTFPTTTVTYR